MKSHSGRRSFLRFATSKRNRIISLCILPLVLLLSFLGSSRTVYADYEGWAAPANFTVANANLRNVRYIASDYQYQGTNSYGTFLGCDGYYEIVLDIRQEITFTYQLAVAQQLYGNSYLEFSVSLNWNSWPTGTSRGQIVVDEFLSTRSDNDSLYLDYSTSDSSYIKIGITCYELGTIGKRSPCYDTFIVKLILPVYNYSSSTGQTYIQNMSMFPMPTVTTSITSTRCSYFLGDSYNELLSDIKSSLGSSGAVVSAINSAKNQAASDAAVAQSQAADLIDDINYDHSGTSQSVSATQSAYDAAQGAADAAVDAAVHSYASDLSTVEAYDYSSFFTSQRNSAVFWRDVGEYILDSSNLGFVSGSIIIVTLIGLVIFMLRL